MTPPPFSVRTTPRFERLARALRKSHPEFDALQERAVKILKADPYNRSREHHIRKLEAVALGDGQWRLSLGRFRLRYDIYDNEVILQYCGLRREDTYR
jgi:mRNA-degrading endonuclease RelE of RelBE toxin-antitoxin system